MPIVFENQVASSVINQPLPAQVNFSGFGSTAPTPGPSGTEQDTPALPGPVISATIEPEPVRPCGDSGKVRNQYAQPVQRSCSD